MSIFTTWKQIKINLIITFYTEDDENISQNFEMYLKILNDASEGPWITFLQITTFSHKIFTSGFYSEKFKVINYNI